MTESTILVPPESITPSSDTPSSEGAKPPSEVRVQVTAEDHERLQQLIDTWPLARDREAVEALADEIARAEVMPAEGIPEDVVTMNSHVIFEDEQDGSTSGVWLVYPQESDPGRGKISVLAPVGSALLGLAVGQSIAWPLPRRKTKRLRVVKVSYQPEGAGDWHL
ncbi:MAG: nucleoside diphosphate kinase regulator [Pseudomonadota bacterium]